MVDSKAINKGILQQSIMRSRRARHQTHSQDVAQPSRHLTLGGIWINGGTDETGRHIPRITNKERRAVRDFLAAEDRDIARKCQPRVEV